jgi:hypothetical protein
MTSVPAAATVAVDLGSPSDSNKEVGSSPTSSASEDSILAELSGNLKDDLLHSLEEVQSSRTFASFGVLEDFIDPGIHIDGQTLSLPLSECGAQHIIQASHKAPFGKGSETIVDTSVRNTWEINRENFQLQNRKWGNYMRDILWRVTDELELSDGPETIRAELYKMLLYEKGAMFKPHTE